MKCYYHPEKDAVALCKNCSKALCKECAVDVSNGMACKNYCEEAVKEINELIARNKTAYKKTSKIYLRGAIIYGLLGLSFLLLGIYSLLFEKYFFIIFYLFSVGIICLLGSFFSYSNSKKVNKVEG